MAPRSDMSVLMSDISGNGSYYSDSDSNGSGMETTFLGNSVPLNDLERDLTQAIESGDVREGSLLKGLVIRLLEKSKEQRLAIRDFERQNRKLKENELDLANSELRQFQDRIMADLESYTVQQHGTEQDQQTLIQTLKSEVLITRIQVERSRVDLEQCEEEKIQAQQQAKDWELRANEAQTYCREVEANNRNTVTTLEQNIQECEQIIESQTHLFDREEENFQQQIAELGRDLVEAQQRLETERAANNANTNGQVEAQTLRDQIFGLQSELRKQQEGAQQHIQGLEQTLAQLEGEKRTNTEHIQRLTQALAQLEAEKRTSNEHIQRAEQALAQLEGEKRNNTEEFRTNHEELQNNMEELRHDNDELRTNNEELKDSVGQLQDRLNEVESENAELQQIADSSQVQYNAKVQEVEGLRQQMHNTHEEMRNIRNAAQDAQTRTNDTEITQLRVSLEGMRAELHETTRQCDELNQQCIQLQANWREKEAEAQSWQGECQKLQAVTSDNQRLQAECNHLRTQLEGLNRTANETVENARQLAELQSKAQELYDEKLKIERERDGVRAEYTQTRTKADEMMHDITRLQEEVKTLQGESQRANQMKTRDDETISKLTTDLTNVMGEKQNAERDVMQHQDQINNLTHQLQQRASIIANDESSAERAMDKMHESIAELGNVKVKLAQAERECEALRTKVASLDDTERAHANEVIEMRTTNDDQKSLIREQQQEIDRLRNKVSQLESDIVQIRLSNDTDTEKEWNIEKAKMDSYQDKLTHIINEREEELAESKNQIVHLENELEIIGNDLGRHDIIQECLSTLDGHNQSIKDPDDSKQRLMDILQRLSSTFDETSGKLLRTRSGRHTPARSATSMSFTTTPSSSKLIRELRTEVDTLESQLKFYRGVERLAGHSARLTTDSHEVEQVLKDATESIEVMDNRLHTHEQHARETAKNAQERIDQLTYTVGELEARLRQQGGLGGGASALFGAGSGKNLDVSTISTEGSGGNAEQVTIATLRKTIADREESINSVQRTVEELRAKTRRLEHAATSGGSDSDGQMAILTQRNDTLESVNRGMQKELDKNQVSLLDLRAQLREREAQLEQELRSHSVKMSAMETRLRSMQRLGKGQEGEDEYEKTVADLIKTNQELMANLNGQDAVLVEKRNEVNGLIRELGEVKEQANDWARKAHEMEQQLIASEDRNNEILHSMRTGSASSESDDGMFMSEQINGTVASPPDMRRLETSMREMEANLSGVDNNRVMYEAAETIAQLQKANQELLDIVHNKVTALDTSIASFAERVPKEPVQTYLDDVIGSQRPMDTPGLVRNSQNEVQRLFANVDRNLNHKLKHLVDTIETLSGDKAHLEHELSILRERVHELQQINATSAAAGRAGDSVYQMGDDSAISDPSTQLSRNIHELSGEYPEARELVQRLEQLQLDVQRITQHVRKTGQYPDLGAHTGPRKPRESEVHLYTHHTPHPKERPAATSTSAVFLSPTHTDTDTLRDQSHTPSHTRAHSYPPGSREREEIALIPSPARNKLVVRAHSQAHAQMLEDATEGDIRDVLGDAVTSIAHTLGLCKAVEGAVRAAEDRHTVAPNGRPPFSHARLALVMQALEELEGSVTDALTMFDQVLKRTRAEVRDTVTDVRLSDAQEVQRLQDENVILNQEMRRLADLETQCNDKLRVMENKAKVFKKRCTKKLEDEHVRAKEDRRDLEKTRASLNDHVRILHEERETWLKERLHLQQITHDQQQITRTLKGRLRRQKALYEAKSAQLANALKQRGTALVSLSTRLNTMKEHANQITGDASFKQLSNQMAKKLKALTFQKDFLAVTSAQTLGSMYIRPFLRQTARGRWRRVLAVVVAAVRFKRAGVLKRAEVAHSIAWQEKTAELFDGLRDVLSNTVSLVSAVQTELDVSVLRTTADNLIELDANATDTSQYGSPLMPSSGHTGGNTMHLNSHSAKSGSAMYESVHINGNTTRSKGHRGVNLLYADGPKSANMGRYNEYDENGARVRSGSYAAEDYGSRGRVGRRSAKSPASDIEQERVMLSLSELDMR